MTQNRIPVLPTFRKEKQRFSTDPNRPQKLDGWLYSSEDSRGQYCKFIDFRSDVESEWYSNGVAVEADPAKAAEAEARRREHAAEEARERAERQGKAVQTAGYLWHRAKEGAHPYLERKKLSGAYGTRVIDDKDGNAMLLVPMYSADGVLVNVQRIYADGRKLFLAGGRVDAMHTIGGAQDFILVCEGFATGATLHEAMGRTVYVALTKNNLDYVVKSIIEAGHPADKIIICGDNDQFTTKPDGTAWNPGLEAAIKVARASGARASWPLFNSLKLETKPTDWNDLAALDGLTEVRAQLAPFLSSTKSEPAASLPAIAPVNAPPAPASAPEVIAAGSEKPDWWVEALGFYGSTYYYTSSSNKQITDLAAGSHNCNQLLSLMPWEYWNEKYPSGKEGTGVNWQRAGSDLMAACRARGLYDASKVRGRGCWRDQQRMFVHLGDHLVVDGKRQELRGQPSKFIYRLQHELPEIHAEPLTEDEGRELRRVCQLMSWTTPEAAALFAGYGAVMRIAGALPWRPHLWLTGAPGTGKSQSAMVVLRNLAGDWAEKVEGGSSASGIRQALFDDARPVIYDDADSDTKQGKAMMRQMLEYVRQASSGDGRIVKGTPGGKALVFKVNCTFVIGAVRVELKQEADLTRFTVVELSKAKKNTWETVLEGVESINAQYGERLFARMVMNFPKVEHAIQVLRSVMTKTMTGREADQASAMLAGLWVLENDALIDVAAAEAFIAENYRAASATGGDMVPDEVECVDQLLSTNVVVRQGQDSLRVSVGSLVHQATGNIGMLEQLELYGMTVKDGALFIANRHPELERIFKDTKWDGSWSGSLKRLPMVRSERVWFRDRKRPHGVLIGLDVVFAKGDDD